MIQKIDNSMIIKENVKNNGIHTLQNGKNKLQY